MPVSVVEYTPGIPFGKRVYLDVNVVISVMDVAGGRPHAPKRAFADILSQRANIVLSTLFFDELWWGLLQELNEAAGNGRCTSDKIVNDPDRHLRPYQKALQQATNSVLGWPHTQWAPTMRAIQIRDRLGTFLTGATDRSAQVRNMLETMKRAALTPRDAAHFYLAHAADAATFVTEDSDFDHLEGNDVSSLQVVKAV